jgi:hypothetical protein
MAGVITEHWQIDGRSCHSFDMRAAATAFALLGSACWSTTAGEPAAPAQPAPAAVRVDEAAHPSWVHKGAAAQPRRSERFPLHSVWEGTYRCAQGLSAVRLTIDASAGGDAVAIYEFGAVPSNPTVPSGSFRLRGRMTGTANHFEGDFEAEEWIVRPPNFHMVGMSVETRDPRTLAGTIRHPSCSDFEATRAD